MSGAHSSDLRGRVLDAVEAGSSARQALLRKAATRTKQALWNEVSATLDAFTPDECANYFSVAGYEPE